MGEGSSIDEPTDLTSSSSSTAFSSAAMESPPAVCSADQCNSNVTRFSFSDLSDSIDTSKPFCCAICLELVYKPIVQACGHIFCFWCAHQSMNVERESHCPSCRRPYTFFPRVCKMLHFMLMKALREIYNERSKETQSMEEQRQVFSPRFLDSPRQTWSPRKIEESARISSELTTQSTVHRQSACEFHTATEGDRASPSERDTQIGDGEKSNGEHGKVQHKEDCTINSQNVEGGQMENILTIDDFLCSLCSKLVYRPVVLNCGEVFCESCLATVSDVVQCPTCGDPHYGASALVCLELHHFLEQAFPIDYMKRQGESTASKQMPEVQLQQGTVGDMNSDGTDMYLYIGMGCDGCGMFPIVGECWHCEECSEKIGFDLCGMCYQLNGSLSGRFNQQHKPDHRMSKVEPRNDQPMDFDTFLPLNLSNGTIFLRRLTRPQMTGHT